MSSSTPNPADDTLSILANGRELSGWQAIRVTRGCERFPADFEVSLTERYPGNPTEVPINEGDACTVKMEDDPVITGYIDRVGAAITPRSHQLRITGRSKCQDLVDCSITDDNLTGMQFTTTSLVDFATKLAKPYGITVKSMTGDNVPVAAPGGGPVQFNGTLQETPYEAIEQIAHYAGVLVYDDEDGNLVFANVATGQMASGFQEGVNVQAALAERTAGQRFQNYVPVLMNVNLFGQPGAGAAKLQPAHDQGVKRFRRFIVVSEQYQYGQSFAEKRARWEASRRYGRSRSVRVTCDSWRDSAGKLWTPNYTAEINLPSLKLTPSDPWVISEVTFARDADRGTVADLVLMPKTAFSVQPIVLLPSLYDPDDPSGGQLGHV